MSLRTFLFCDFCNPEGIRVLDDRRTKPRADGNSGRRYSDARVWFEGPVEEAVNQNGWIISHDDKHICPDCQERIKRWPGKQLGEFALNT